MMKSLILLAPLLISVFMLSCSSESYDFQHDFGDDCWGIADTIDLLIEKSGPQKKVQLYVDVSQDYVYQNLYLKAYIQGPTGPLAEVMLNDTMFTPSGEWLIPSTASSQKITYARPIPLVGKEGTYKLRLIQFMREDKLCGINVLGASKVE